MAFIFSTAPVMGAATIQFQSEPTPTPLLELYTSEGCSSCPPAEAWLSRLKDSPRLWKDFVPVVFHVDYWDDLGWKDPFAAKVYTQRQQSYAEHWRSSSVYTPGFVLDGKEWRGWYKREELPQSSRTPVGVLTARSEDGRQWKIRFQPSTADGNLTCDIQAALLGFELGSKVKAGENRGRELQHDFVALSFVKVAATKDGKAFQTVVSLNSKPATSTARLGLAAWVTPSRSWQPVQAVGGWLTSTNRAP